VSSWPVVRVAARHSIWQLSAWEVRYALSDLQEARGSLHEQSVSAILLGALPHD
jgi:hypothetical protein